MKLTNENVDDLIYALDYGVDISKTQKATVCASLNAEMCENDLNTDSNLATDAMLYDFDNVSDVEPSAIYDVDFYDTQNNIVFAKHQVTEPQMLKYIHEIVKTIRKTNQGD